MPVLAGAVYALLAWAAAELSNSGTGLAMIWPANAMLTAFLLRSPAPQWPGLLAAAFIGNYAAALFSGVSAVTPFFFGIANLLQAVIAARALKVRWGEPCSLRDTRALFSFLLWTGLVAPAVSGIPAALTAWTAYDRPLIPAFLRWISSDALALLIFTPVFSALLHGEYNRFLRTQTKWKCLESAALLALTGWAGFWVFYVMTYPGLLLLMVPLMLVTFRVGPLGAKTALMLVTVIICVATTSGHGPLVQLFRHTDLQMSMLQVVVAMLYVLVIPIAATLAARDDLTAKLRESEQSLRLLAEQSPVLILAFDLEGVCQRVIGTADLMLGRNPATLAGKSFQDISEEGQFQLRNAHDRALDDIGNSHAAEFRAFRVNNRWLEAVFRANFDNQGRCIGTLATLLDVTARKQYELDLSRSAYTDSLTGLWNRAGFRAKLEQALETAAQGSISLALIDVDKFKLVNDNLGHQAGDAVLQEIARRISSEVRASDVVGRLGGDEFVILLATTDWRQVQDICKRIVNVVAAAPVDLASGTQLATAISCGVARHRLGLDADGFIHEADVALYEAKRGGRNRVIAA